MYDEQDEREKHRLLWENYRPQEDEGYPKGPSVGKRTLVDKVVPVWRAASGEAGAADPSEAIARAEGSSGAPLPAELAQKFGSALGADLSAVRVHTGAESAQAAEAVAARAYTVGHSIHFAAGQYDPASAEGQKLLAHEVAHTVQQGTGPVAPQAKLEVSQPGDAAEVEADRAADRLMVGGPVRLTAALNGSSVHAKRDPILYVGMNVGAEKEAAALSKANSDRGGTLNVIDSGGKIRTATDEYNLADEEQRRMYIQTLRLSRDAEDRVLTLLGVAGDAVDELARLIGFYAAAEEGRGSFSRMVLSGHSFGSGDIHGPQGTFEISWLVTLRYIFPRAAGRVNDLMVAACNAFWERDLPLYREAFPNLRSIWGHGGFSPKQGEGAEEELILWERQTEAAKGIVLKPEEASATTWQPGRRYSGQRGELSELRGVITAFQPDVDHCYAGQGDIQATPDDPSLQRYYTALQALLDRDIPADEREAARAKLERVKRLRFYPSLRVAFMREHGDEVRRGYQSAGLETPTYETLDRASALRAIVELEGRQLDGEEARHALRLLDGDLRRLDPTLVPEAWLR